MSYCRGVLSIRDDIGEEETMLVMVTGLPGTGKSTLCRKILSALHWKAGGFCTMPVMHEGKRVGFDMFPMEEGKIITPGFPMARFKVNGELEIYPEAFTVIGVKAVERSLNSKSECIFMDEIGRFEKDNTAFLNAVWDAVVQKEIPVLVVLKKENLPFNLKVWSLEEALHLDLDLVDREEAYNRALHYFTKGRKKL